QPVYAEIHVPEAARPGEYRGRVVVTAQGQKPRHLDLLVTVWDFALPQSPVCQSNFGSFSRVVRQAGLPDDSPEARVLIRRLDLVLIPPRVLPGMPPGARPQPGPDGTPDVASVLPILRDYFETQHANALDLSLPIADSTGTGREKAVRYLRGYYDFLAAHGW